MSDIFLFDGNRTTRDEARISALGSAAMFGNQAFERMRGFYDNRGQLRIRALTQHLERACRSSQLLFGRRPPEELKILWREWIIEAVRASKYREPYIHLGHGQFAPQGAMLQPGQSELGTFIHISQAPPLYGSRVSLYSEREWPRPQGPLTPCKVSGNYAALLLFKNRARARQSGDPQNVIECILFDQTSFRCDAPGSYTLYEDDPFVAELGCSNILSVGDDNLHLPDQRVSYFHGISVQIVEAVFRQLYPDRRVLNDLRRAQLLQSGGAIGTATRDLIPVAEVDGTSAITNDTFLELAKEYFDLCRGASSFPELQEEWAPVA